VFKFKPKVTLIQLIFFLLVKNIEHVKQFLNSGCLALGCKRHLFVLVDESYREIYWLTALWEKKEGILSKTVQV